MAARATGRPRQSASQRPAEKQKRAPAKTTSAKTKPAKKAAPAKKTATAKKGAPPRKSPANKAVARSTRSQPRKKTVTPADNATAEMLREQNEALRAELEQAHARIQQLEELNRNVVNRIDWVIDSLQSALAAKS